jgi:hypothetical protein
MMEPNTESTLALIEVSEIDHERYATYHTLSNPRALNPLLWRKAVGLVVSTKQLRVLQGRISHGANV